MNYLESDEDLYFGFIRGDDVWHHIGWLHQVFSNLQGLAGRTGSMRFPLEWESKADVVQKMKNHGLYRHCWWCEECDPKTVRGVAKPCGICKSCRTNDTALWQISQGHLPED